ncbi:MAG TPA: hypothetical protein VES01_00570 [Dermatophilaceae bacterium]|nr:hypothetical protein [Dermatophilaceae bacterium]
MAAGRGRLDTLLRVRRIEEDRVKAELARANVAHREAEAAVQRAHGVYRERAQDRPRGAVAEFLGAQQRAAAAAKSVVLAGSALQEVTRRTESAREEVRIAVLRSEGLQRLVERAAQALLAETLAADQRTAEESRAAKKPRGRR